MKRTMSREAAAARNLRRKLRLELSPAECESIAHCSHRTFADWIAGERFESRRPVDAGSGRRWINRESFRLFLGISEDEMKKREVAAWAAVDEAQAANPPASVLRNADVEGMNTHDNGPPDPGNGRGPHPWQGSEPQSQPGNTSDGPDSTLRRSGDEADLRRRAFGTNSKRAASG